MERAIAETNRRRKIQVDYNTEHHITPYGIKKAIKDITQRVQAVSESKAEYVAIPETREDISRLIKEFEKQMKMAAKNLEFEKAALIRDRIIELRHELTITGLPQ
jgi:excinuclease ABC subunit B